MTFDFKSFFNKCIRVWHLLKKPTREEFILIAKISAVGIVIMGLAGFLISTVVRSILPR
ncbi:MAG: protein translocase SEC61 complex subunit gamma [Candidatus Pacearchaeota archaeon]